MQLFHSWIGFFALISAVACGNTRVERAEPDDGGNTPVDDGNTPVDGRAPDRDPTAPPAQASLFFVIGPPGVPGAGCAISNYVAKIGGPPNSTNGDPGPREVDGQNFARIGCRVSGSSTFELSGSAEQAATTFRVLDAVVSAGQSGSATIGVSGPGTAGKVLTSTSDMPCQLSVARAPFQVNQGLIWAEFNCPVVSNPTDPGSNCSARGEFVFENCEQ